MTNDRLISENVGTQVKAIRLARGMTVKQLVDECAATGWQVTPATINNIEGARRIPKGAAEPGPRREVSVDELLALSVVLGVNPVDLLVPGDAKPDEPVAIPPDLEVPAAVARAWIGGTGFLVEPAGTTELAEVLRRVPANRGAKLNEVWWNKERIAESNRLALEAERAAQEARLRTPEGDEAPGEK